MRRLMISIALLLSLLVAAIPAQADASVEYQLKSRGSTASAAFSTLPSSGALPDTVYTDTHVFAAHDATTADGTRYRDDIAYVDQYSYKLGEDGWFVPVAYRYGFAHGQDVSLATRGKLTTASLHGSVPMTRCEVTGGWWSTCSDAGVSAVDVEWIGEGELSRGLSLVKLRSASSQYISRANGDIRAASATGTLGADNLGAASWAELSSTSSMSLTICHDC